MTITREQQKQILIDTANHVISRDNTSPYSENLRELARIALASLEAEPIGAFHIADQQVGGTSDYIKDGEWPIDNGVIEVYAAPPASEREQIRREHAEWSDATFGDVGPVGPLKHLSKEALEAAAEPEDLSEWADMQFLLWDAQRRAGITDKQITLAMVEKLAVNKKREWPEPKDGEPRLHIKEQPAPVVPEKLPCSVELKPGLIIGKGCKTETLLTALRRRADYYAKIDAFTPEERAEHDASIEAFKAMLPTPADSQGRPRAPVVPPAIEPDYKVIKSILPTANPDEYACCIAADMWNACRGAMLQDRQPVSQTYNLPELIEGMEVSIDVSTCDADAGNRYFGTVTEVSELYTAKNGYILLVQDAEPNFDVNGNSPVIPDGYVLVPVEPTPEMREAFHISNEEYKSGTYDGWSPDHQWQAMLAAAPQQEASN
ncbi:TPA: DUF550 domain-containing protein [Salmonella enterica subsp. enterica serovar Birkenhead]|nr:DUF550 domain-containing protein [Salmonella enterica]